MERGAVIDSTGQYRYSLTRAWDRNKPKVTFIMLNGSTADADKDDPTLRRCIKFAKYWGYGVLEVVNLFGYRTTFPIELKKAVDPVGSENDKYITAAVTGADKVIVAWGNNGAYRNQDRHVMRLLRGLGIMPCCIKESKDRFPCHPLYLKSNLSPKPYTYLWEGMEV